jgi:dipeptidyl aminopeptidase/acylaminoacyl peptidase
MAFGILVLPAVAEQPNWTPELMMKVKQIPSVAVSPDAKRVVFTVREAVMTETKSEFRTHIHLANADGSDPLPLTHGEKSCDHPDWSPDGERIGFLSARSGKRNVWLIHVRGGEAERLTDSKTDVTSFKWSPDGKTIAFTATDAPTAEEEKANKEKNDAWVVDENIKLRRLFVMPVEQGKGKRTARQLTAGTLSVGDGFKGGGFDWSPDSRTIVFSHARSPRPDDWTTSDLSLVDVESGTVKPLTRTRAAEYSPLYSPDSKWIAYVVSDDPPTWAGYGRAHIIPADGGSGRPLADTADGFGRYSELIGWSADSKKIYYAEVRGTSLHVGALPLEGEPEQLGQADGMALTGLTLNRGRTTLGLGWETTGKSAEAHLSPVDRFQPAAVSHFNKSVAGVTPGKTEVIRWKSVDNQEIEGLLTYPQGYKKGSRYPLLLIVHGGPMGVFTQTFTGSAGPYPVAVFAERGYAVLRCNPRGSSGYGKLFRYANYGDWGGKDYQDLMAGIDKVLAMEVADPERLGVMGWSYGGFMISWIVTQTKRFKAASVGAGVTDLVSFTGTADIPSFLPDYFGGEPWEVPEAYRKHSAMFHVKGVTTPTLIQHGDKDERVPLSQGQEFYNALKRQGCTTKMVIYPRTPHGIEEPKLLLDCMMRNVEWFEKFVVTGKR